MNMQYFFMRCIFPSHSNDLQSGKYEFLTYMNINSNITI